MKTKFGVGVGLMAALVYLLTLFGGWTGMVVVFVVGWLLYKESDEFLRVSVVKAFLVAVAFSLLNTLLGLVFNDLIGIIDNIMQIFGAEKVLSYTDFGMKLNQIHALLANIIDIVRTVVILLLASMALSKKTMALPVIDRMIAKHILR